MLSIEIISILGEFDDDLLRKYLAIITELFPQLSNLDSISFDDDDDDPMEWNSDSHNSPISLSEMRADCLRILNSPSHVARILQLTSNDNSTLLSVAQLCHTLTSKLNQRVHSSR